jgi:uncharacterized protein
MEPQSMKILAVSDQELDFLHNPSIKSRFKDVDLLINCGDLSYFYYEYMISMLDVPAYFVRGNHSPSLEYGEYSTRAHPWGAFDLHRRCLRDRSGLLLAGVEGSVDYNGGDFQYSQIEMWRMVLLMTPALIINRYRFGRSLDVFVSHAAPWKIEDGDDLPHQGIRAFRWLINVFQPKIHLHGHIHLSDPSKTREALVKKTRVINAYLYSEIKVYL